MYIYVRGKSIDCCEAQRNFLSRKISRIIVETLNIFYNFLPLSNNFYADIDEWGGRTNYFK